MIISLEMQVLLAPIPQDVRDLARTIAALPPSPRGRPREDLRLYLDGTDPRPLSALTPDWLAGTPEEVSRLLRAFIDMGVSHFMVWFLDFPAPDGLRLFAERVLPAVRTGGAGPRGHAP